jgi:hypothetical protein
VTAGDTDVVQIVETNAELRANKGVSRGLKLTSDAVRLEAVDTGLDIVNIVSPTSNDGVTLDSGGRDTSRGKGTLESLPRLSIGKLLAGSADTTARTDEAILLVTLRVTASNTGLVLAPVVSTTRRTVGTVEANSLQGLSRVVFLGVRSELGLCKRLQLLLR